MQLVVFADSDIKGPTDLKGRTVNVTAFQETTFYALLGMLAAVGLSKDDVNIQATGASNIWKFFLARKADAMAGVPDFIAEVQDQGAKIRVIPSSAYFESMGQAILASDQTIKERPQLVRKLVRATLRGMKDIMDDPAAAAAAYVGAVPDRQGREKHIQRVFELYKQYVYGGQKILGEMNRGQLAKLQAFYVKQGISQSALPVDDLFTKSADQGNRAEFAGWSTQGAAQLLVSGAPVGGVAGRKAGWVHGLGRAPSRLAQRGG